MNELNRREFMRGGIALTSLILFPLSAMAQGGRAPSQRIALAIGNSHYSWEGCGSTTAACRLKSPARDAKAVAEMFRQLGFDTRLLINSKREEMAMAFADFRRRATISDVAAFYFSGHGIQVDGYNYLIPSDGSLPVDGFSAEHDCVPLDWARSAIGGANRLGLMLIDACRENPFVNAIRDEPQNSRTVFSSSLVAEDPPNSFIVGFATRGAEVAKDGPKNELSPYARSLVTYLADKDSSLEDALKRVSTSVCDLTSPKAEADGNADACQQPIVYGVFGFPPLFLVDDEAAIDTKSPYSLLTNLQMADPADPAVRAILGKENSEFQFKYIIDDSNKNSARIFPNLDYFVSLYERKNRPFFEAFLPGYLATEEAAGTWSLSYPIVDLISRRADRKKVSIEEILFESKNSQVDTTPYASIVCEDTELFSLTLVNQSAYKTLDCDIHFDVIGFSQSADVDVFDRDLVDRPLKFIFSMSRTIEESLVVDLSEQISPYIPDISFFAYIVDKMIVVDEDSGKIRVFSQPNDDGEEGDELVPPVGFVEWYKRVIHDGWGPDRFWIVGRLISRAPTGEIAEADFAATPVIYTGGVGGGAIGYDLLNRVPLPIDGLAHKFVIPIRRTLKKDKETFRGLFPLVAESSSHHEVRVTINDASGSILFQSPWIKTHIYVSEIDKRSIERELGANLLK